MPWLEKDKVLFIHVPRCGGTSITKHHRVGPKSQEGRNLYQRLGIKYYYYRYRLLETANFPYMTIENGIALFQFTLAFFLFFFFPGLPVPYVMWCTCTLLFVNSTFVWTAPLLMRINFLRLALMYFQDYILQGFGCDTRYLIGSNRNGYLFHLTAERCIRYGYVSEADMKQKSFSIIRNPYSRAVSMYEYNKRLFESFDHFVKDFYQKGMKVYHEQGKTDSKYIYCHILPMHAYTHIKGKQVVNTIIKQEQLKRLVATEWKDSGVPDVISEALTGIPHANARKKKQAWQDYFTQETMDMVLEMYEKDFDIFGYEKTIPGRTDLIPKIRVRARSVSMINTTETLVGTLLRKSVSLSGKEANEHTKAIDIEQGPLFSNVNPAFANRKVDDEVLKPKATRSVSISDNIKTKIYEPSATSPKFSLERIPERRDTSAGEETSESVDISRISFVDKPNLDVLNKHFDDETSISRKKRSASAFILHQD